LVQQPSNESDETLAEEPIQMACNNGSGFTPNVVVGIAMTAVGTVLMLDTLDLVNARDVARYWPVLLIMFGASVVFQAFRGGPDSGAGGRGQRAIITPGFVIFFLVAGLLVSNAFPRIILRPDRRNDSVVAVMGRAARTSDARTFTGANMTTVMGRSRLDLREATMAPGEQAIVDVFGLMGAVELIVPEGWVVDVEAVPLMGRVDDSRLRTTRIPTTSTNEPQRADAAGEAVEDARPPRVVVRGFMMMGRLNIRS
jgi:hypothetical protein